MANAYVVPSRYRRVLAAAIANAVADIGRDVKRRERGEPTGCFDIPDELLDKRAIGDVLVTVAEIADGAEVREAVAGAAARDPFLERKSA